MTPLGEVIYLRTYARYLEDQGRRETWPETVDRVVAFSASLGPTSQGELEALRDTLLHLRGFPAGRTLWVGGTPYAAQGNGQAQFNCAFMDVEDSKDFHDMVMLLMSGSGVGFRVTEDNLAKLEANLPIQRVAEVRVEPYTFLGYDHYFYSPRTSFSTTGYREEFRLVVGDSREGWAEAVAAFLRAVTTHRRVYVNLDRIRPLGERLRTFGGYASGPEPLREFFLAVPQILKRAPEGRWTSTKVLDLMNLIGRMVVAGGTRRSAQIALGNSYDQDFIQAKTGTWWQEAPWRSQSNNTILFDVKPDLDQLLAVLDSVLQYGEPGFLNAEAARKRRTNFRGINPCAEILLDNHGFCNLATAVLPRHVRQGRLDLESLTRTLRLLTRHALRITNVAFPQSLKEWAEVQYRDRLIGISFTGYGDLVDALDLSPKDQQELLAYMHRVVREEAQAYAKAMGVPEPILATTVKPEGTLSLLPGVSSGVHPSYAPYYIRRVRISKMDAVAKALQSLGMEPKPEVGFASLEEAHTWVFEFPVATPAKRPAHSYTAIEQLERYKLVNTHYTEHNTSITVYLHPSEKEEVARWLLENWDSYVAVSFLPKDDTVYPLMPFEQISREAYEALAAGMPDLSRLKETVDFIERFGALMGDDLDPSCATGACPVR